MKMPKEIEKFGSSDEYDLANADLIGRGTFGLVYKASIRSCWPWKACKFVAVKKFGMKTGDFNKERIRLIKLLQLKHDNLVNCRKLRVTTNTETGMTELEIMMDYCNGSDLANLLEGLRADGRLLCPKTGVRYAREIATGLMFLHKKAVIHGDLKPQNVFVQHLTKDKTRLVIGDLDDIITMNGDATTSQDFTRLTGTIRYMSPEMLKTHVAHHANVKPPGKKTDIWSFGCLLVELADHMVDNDSKWLRKEEDKVELDNISELRFQQLIIDGYVPDLVDSLPPALAACIRKCFHENSKTRLSARKLARSLKKVERKAPREITLLMHHYPNRLFFARTAVQCFDPLSRVVYELPTPLEISKGIFSHGFTALGSALICQTLHNKTADMDCLKMDTIQWNITQKTLKNAILCNSSSEMMFCPVVVKHKVYYFGPRYNTDGSTSANVALKVADIRAKTIETLMDLEPDKSSCVTTLKGVRHGNKIIYLGMEVDSMGLWMGSFDTTVPLESAWESLPRFPEDRFGFAMVMLQGSVYVLGGCGLPIPNPNISPMLKSCYRLNMQPGKRSWENVRDLIQPRTNHCAFVLNKRIHVYGGTGIQPRYKLLQTMEVYDPADNVWSVKFVAALTTDQCKSDRGSTVSVQLQWPPQRKSRTAFLDDPAF